MSIIRDNLQSNIIALLKEKNLSQKKFAELLGVTQTAVTNWVKGKNSPDIELIAKMCQVFNVKFSELINFEPEINQQKKILIHNYDQLNDSGKEKLLEYSEDLIGNAKYTTPDIKEKHA